MTSQRAFTAQMARVYMSLILSPIRPTAYKVSNSEGVQDGKKYPRPLRNRTLSNEKAGVPREEQECWNQNS
jgi:hypothetical protein